MLEDVEIENEFIFVYLFYPLLVFTDTYILRVACPHISGLKCILKFREKKWELVHTMILIRLDSALKYKKYTGYHFWIYNYPDDR